MPKENAETEMRRVVHEELETARLPEIAADFSCASEPFSVNAQIRLLTDITREYRRRLRATEELKETSSEANQEHTLEPKNTAA
jgi:hypothetical protein